MLTFATKAKVMAFVVIAVATITFLAIHYVGLDRFLGGYRFTVDMPEAGGLFTNSEVTYRGVPIGRVESLTATADGAHAVVRIKRGAPVMPASVTARVVDRSAIGEQYLDLRGDSTAGEHLGEGDHITMTAADLPPAMDTLLRSSRDFVASVPSDALNTVIDETYEFTRGNGANLARLVNTSAEFARTADRNFLVTASLIDNSGKVLATQKDVSSSFQSFSKSIDEVAHAFKDEDADWRRLIESTPATATELSKFFTTVGQPLGQLMTNLVSTATVFGTNAAGVKETMIMLPEGLSITYAVLTSKGMLSGIEPTFFTPLPCTQGYEGTTMHTGLETSGSGIFNTKAGCTSKTNVRGPQSVLKSTTTLSDLLGGSK
ncbi:MlaD family protein [Nocardioides sp.]|uniref:MlaD family protein n=1 Tax=Nocardioides sp. TaxID=35761 RepID=UPI00261175F1|nr:MlaD family protein [Nocardioides sp.]